MSSNLGFQPHIAIVTALPIEFEAMRRCVDNPVAVSIPNGQMSVVQGKMKAANDGWHVIALCLLPNIGTTVAGIVANTLISAYPTLREIIMVGIAGGIPRPDKPEQHVNLGDIVACSENGVIQFDRGARLDNEFEIRSTPAPPSKRLLQADKMLAAAIYGDRVHWPQSLNEFLSVYGVNWPNEHQGKGSKIHRGLIGTSNAVLRDAQLRDVLARKHDIVAVEMEGSGIADAATFGSVGFFIIRGICDHADSNKNDAYHEYAAHAAAHYCRILMAELPVPVNMVSEMISSIEEKQGAAPASEDTATTVQAIQESLATLAEPRTSSDEEKIRRFAEKYPETQPQILITRQGKKAGVTGVDLDKLPELKPLFRDTAVGIDAELKWENFLDEGGCVEFSSEEIEGISHPLQELTETISCEESRPIIRLEQRLPDLSGPMVFVTNDGSGAPVELPGVVRMISRGRKRMVLRFEDVDSIMGLRVPFDPSQSVARNLKVDLSSDPRGKKVAFVLKVYRFLQVLAQGGLLTARSKDGDLCKMGVIGFPDGGAFIQEGLNFGGLLERFEQGVGVELLWPDKISKEDSELLNELLFYGENGRLPCKVNSVSVTADRTILKNVLAMADNGLLREIYLQSHDVVMERLFGQTISLGYRVLRMPEVTMDPGIMELDKIVSQMGDEDTLRMKFVAVEGNPGIVSYRRQPIEASA